MICWVLTLSNLSTAEQIVLNFSSGTPQQANSPSRILRWLTYVRNIWILTKQQHTGSINCQNVQIHTVHFTSQNLHLNQYYYPPPRYLKMLWLFCNLTNVACRSVTTFWYFISDAHIVTMIITISNHMQPLTKNKINFFK